MVNKSIKVTAAVIQNNNGDILLCQRPEHKKHGLLWEFPGGKVEPKETNVDCLIRECKEELGVTIDVIKPYDTVSGDGVTLMFFIAKIHEGNITKYEHKETRWVRPKDVKLYELCPNDRRMVQNHPDLF